MVALFEERMIYGDVMVFVSPAALWCRARCVAHQHYVAHHCVAHHCGVELDVLPTTHSYGKRLAFTHYAADCARPY